MVLYWSLCEVSETLEWIEKRKIRLRSKRNRPRLISVEKRIGRKIKSTVLVKNSCAYRKEKKSFKRNDSVKMYRNAPEVFM